MGSFNQSIQPFLLSAVYNYAQPHRQPHVWNDLIQLSNTYSGKWLILGDLTVFLMHVRKIGGGGEGGGSTSIIKNLKI